MRTGGPPLPWTGPPNRGHSSVGCRLRLRGNHHDEQPVHGLFLSGNVGNVAIGSTPTKPCQNPAVQISWNQTGWQGDQGPAGPQGPQGVTGARGEVGATGAKGQKGDTGPPGAPGAKGDTGANGAPGVTGATGPSGPIGATGPPGSSPAAGTSCQTGEFVVASTRQARSAAASAAQAAAGPPTRTRTAGRIRSTPARPMPTQS